MYYRVPAAAGTWVCVRYLGDTGQKVLKKMNENFPTINVGSRNTIQDEGQPTGLLSVSSGAMKGRKAGPILKAGH